MKSKLLYVFLLPLLSFVAKEPKIITWQDLSSVHYRNSYSPSNEMFYDKPIFDKNILKLHDTEVVISGYIIPVDTYKERFFLSANPNSSCYFCGGAQKHTVLVLNLKNLPANYKMDEYLSFKGILKTHTGAVDLPFSLNNAQEYKGD